MDNDKIELGQPGPFMAGVVAGIKAFDAIDVPGETTFDQRAAFFWLHVGTSMASAGLVDAESQVLFVEGAKTRAPSREVREVAEQDRRGPRLDYADVRESLELILTATQDPAQILLSLDDAISNNIDED